MRVSIRNCPLVATVSGFPQTACAVDVVALRCWYSCYRGVYIRCRGWAWTVVSVLIEPDWRRLINCRKSILMCRNTDVLVSNEFRRFVKGGICILWNESANLKILNAFPSLLRPFISGFQLFFHVIFHSFLASIHSVFFLVLLLSVCPYFHSLLFLPLFFHSISSVLLSFLLSFLPFILSSLPPFFRPSIISCFHTLFATVFSSSFLAILFLLSSLRCFRSSLFSPYFQLNSFPPAFLYGNRGRANRVDSKSRRRTSVYWYDRTSKVLKTNNFTRCWNSDFHLYEWLSKFLKQ